MPGALAPHALTQRGQHERRAMVAYRQPEGARRGRGNEAGGLEDRLKPRQDLADRRRQVARLGGRHHAARRSDEELVLEHLAEHVQRPADGRLGHADVLGGARDAALAHQCLEDQQQSDVDGA